MLLLLESGLFLNKNSDKENTIIAPSIEYGKIVIVLLDEVIIVYVRLTLIHIGSFGLEELFSRFVKIVPNKGLRL